MSKLDDILLNLGYKINFVSPSKAADELIKINQNIKDLFRQLVIDSLEEDPINTLEVLRKKIGEL